MSTQDIGSSDSVILVLNWLMPVITVCSFGWAAKSKEFLRLLMMMEVSVFFRTFKLQIFLVPFLRKSCLTRLATIPLTSWFILFILIWHCTGTARLYIIRTLRNISKMISENGMYLSTISSTLISLIITFTRWNIGSQVSFDWNPGQSNSLLVLQQRIQMSLIFIFF